jgi:hypothetical protein
VLARSETFYRTVAVSCSITLTEKKQGLPIFKLHSPTLLDFTLFSRAIMWKVFFGFLCVAAFFVAFLVFRSEAGISAPQGALALEIPGGV